MKSTPPYWLGIDLGGTKMLAEVYDDNWKRVGAKKRKSKPSSNQQEGLDRLLRTGMDALENAGISPKQLGGVGLGCPGPLNPDTGFLLKATNLGWEEVPLRELLENSFGTPAAVANDVDAGVFGEATAGAGKDARCVLGVFHGTGIGGGLVYHGHIYRGSSQSALEIGHITALLDGPRCGCGRRGCLEAIAGRPAISAAAVTAALRGQAPWLKAHASSNPSKIRSGMLADAIQAGDNAVRDIVEDACSHLGRVLGDMVNLLAPDVIVLGGGLVEAMPSIILPSVRQAMRPRVMDAFADTYQLKPAALADHAVSLGAAALVRKSTQGSPAHE